MRALHHRGPDGSGSFITDTVGFAHTRLSIVDLAGGTQPMTNEDGSVVTVYNGEIWNFTELRTELEAAGHRFRTRCDTEVLVHGYEEWREHLVSRLNGMFAFAIWDERREQLFLARDRLGKKPMYTATTPDGVAFGSDLRSVLLIAGMKPELDEGRVAEFLFQRYVTSPGTLVRGVEKLPPAHVLLYDRERVIRREYWSVRDVAHPIEPAELRELLRESTRRRLMGDVPAGVLLSGGIDSAAVLGLMHEAGAGELATFTIGFEDPLFDERRLARLVAERYATSHHELVVGQEEFVASLPRLAWFRDEPVSEPSEVPLFLLAQFAAQHVKVVLSGDGGDEVFGGYPKYRAERILQLPTGLPALACRLGVRALSSRPTHRRLDRALKSLSIGDPLLRWASWFRSFAPAEISALVRPDLAWTASADALVEPLRQRLELYQRFDPVRKMLVGDLLTYLPDNMLLRSDKVLMSASLEGRMPLLDHRIVERAAATPAADRASLRMPKALLRRATADLVPQAVTSAPKRGFTVPVARFVLSDDRRPLQSLILSERALDRSLFDADELLRVVSGAHGGADHELKLFTLGSLELWLRTNVDTVAPDPPELAVGMAELMSTMAA